MRPDQLHPGGNDIFASVTNLFVAHNKMHDTAYFLGFTEKNYNMQKENFGKTANDRANDPEIGNVQAGALSGGQPSYTGRDNANQIALQDGVPGITNQYLFQPIAGAFYSPCTDGALDMSITGHEYTHAISNRMIAGPDQGISSEQGGAMGESWSDLNAMETQFAFGYSTGTNPWVVGAYATGNKKVGIRDYAINHNPLNYSDYGFDSPGVEVHADGEIWNATQWRVRQALVKKWNKRYPYRDKGLQLRCIHGTAAHSPEQAQTCPGNRRWIQLVFDSFLLQQSATSMLDARDAMLAADQMRFKGPDVDTMWSAFARSGMGKGARTRTADSGQPKPSFATNRKRVNATVRFRPVSSQGRRVRGKVYIGRYEARVTPVADTLAKTKLPATMKLAPGRYPALFQAAGHGLKRFTIRVRPGQSVTKRIRVATNWASRASGAKIAGASAGSLNAKFLIDDTESTNWAGVNDVDSVDAKGKHPWVTIDLAGAKARTIHRVQVSAMLRPASGSSNDQESGSRFTALRRFALETCVRRCGAANAHWKRIFTSRRNAFPAVRPRPVAPNLIMRGFNVPDTRARFVRLVALENQCTGFPGYAGEQDNDPGNATDCKSASTRDLSVRAAELEVY